CASSVRRIASSNGSRPTLTSGGVRYQYRTLVRTLPRRFVVGWTRAKCSYPRLSRVNRRYGTIYFFLPAGFLAEFAFFAGAFFAGAFGAGFAAFAGALVTGATVFAAAALGRDGAGSRFRCTSVNRGWSPMTW